MRLSDGAKRQNEILQRITGPISPDDLLYLSRVESWQIGNLLLRAVVEENEKLREELNGSEDQVYYWRMRCESLEIALGMMEDEQREIA
jgi:hypothetical protein